ncbi:MAG: SAM-dependent methyltransferase [Paenibacillus sp.]|jgi:ubiquinone/menaquinone biosynthesis C-methylase UbiE|nr:SAM-dependent methyltransferase [Paenibacillus sp.]
MPDHTEIYKSEAATYDLLISKQPCLLETIRSICPPDGRDVVDLGAGTGRLTVPIARTARSIRALDASPDMLRVAALKLTQAGLANWSTHTSDHRALSAADHSADLLVSGWSICYVASSNAAGWETHLDAVMTEIGRVVRPGGTAILIETLGTGATTPSTPRYLTGYYALLESKYGFHHRWIRTDYRFDSVGEAERLTRFFFGASLAETVAREKLQTVPECAGIWWRTF